MVEEQSVFSAIYENGVLSIEQWLAELERFVPTLHIDWEYTHTMIAHYQQLYKTER